MNSIKYILTLVLIVTLLTSCSMESELHIVENADTGTFSIGEQTWMSKTLRKKHFNNGDLVPQAQSSKEWELAGKQKNPAWCYVFEKDTSEILYNWYAVSDPRGLAPQGWHIPSHEEILYVIKILYTLNHLRSNDDNVPASYPTGSDYIRYYKEDIHVRYIFPTLFPGHRFGDGYINKQDTLSVCWTSESQYDTTVYIPCFVQTFDKKQVFEMATHPANGLSIRCIKNE